MITEDYLVEDEEINGEKPKKQHKNIALWQAYLWYNEILELRKAHLLRISAIDRGMSNMDKQLELDMLEDMRLDHYKKQLGKQLANYGGTAGPIWEWLTSIKGFKAGLLPAQLIAQIDDIEQSPTIASLWRFCGYAVIEGKAEKNQKGEKSHYNRRLKGICFNIAETFIKQQTPGYVDIYYAEKIRQRELHPVAICRECGIECDVKAKKIKGKDVQVFTCPNNAKHVKNFSDSHIHYRAIRKMMKAFLKDLWLAWRELEGLDIGEEWSG